MTAARSYSTAHRSCDEDGGSARPFALPGAFVRHNRNENPYHQRRLAHWHQNIPLLQHRTIKHCFKPMYESLSLRQRHLIAAVRQSSSMIDIYE